MADSVRISFYDGGAREQGIATKLYLNLVKHTNGILKLRIAHAMQEDMIIKYVWSCFGYCLISIPVFFPSAISHLTPGTSGHPSSVAGVIASRTESYISNRRLLLSLADAGSRLMYSGRDLAELAGYTSRVYNLLSTLHLVNTNQLQMADINGKLVMPCPEGVVFEKAAIISPAPGSSEPGEELAHNLDINLAQGDHVLISGVRPLLHNYFRNVAQQS